MYLPIMYIITKFASVAHPARNRQIANSGALSTKRVDKLPTQANKFATTKTCNLPILSAKMPNTRVPTTEPRKKIDCPKAGFHALSHTQFS